jgi:hypothetical protein
MGTEVPTYFENVNPLAKIFLEQSVKNAHTNMKRYHHAMVTDALDIQM